MHERKKDGREMAWAQIGEDLKAVVSGPSFLRTSEWPFVPQGNRVARKGERQWEARDSDTNQPRQY
jgi:hypothetical protein